MNTDKTIDIYADFNQVISKGFMGLGVQWDPYTVHSLTEAEWGRIEERVSELMPRLVRCMIYAPMYCEGIDEWGKPILNFGRCEVKELERLLSYLEEKKIEVIIGEWEAPSRFKGKFEEVTVDSPRWIEMIISLLEYLIKVKGYTCIKYYNLVNEANADWSFCADFDKWQAGIRSLYQNLKNMGLDEKIKIIGPDTVWDEGNTWLKRLADNPELRKEFAFYDVHMYPTLEELKSGDVERQTRTQREMLSDKCFFMTELGMAEGKTDGDSQSFIRTFDYGVMMADAVTQLMRGGFSGAAIWDLDDAMHDQENGFSKADIRSLKQWGFWNSIGGRIFDRPEEESIRPHYYLWSLMTRLFEKGSDVIMCTTDLNKKEGLRAVATAGEELCIMIVNHAQTPKMINVHIDSAKINGRDIFEYHYFKRDYIGDRQHDAATAMSCSSKSGSSVFSLQLPAMGVSVLSTKKF